MSNNYKIGQKVDISVKDLYRENLKGNVGLDYTSIVSRDENDVGKFDYYDLYNEDNILCCMDGEECTIDHIVYDGMYDLVNRSGEEDIHFMLSKHDLDIAVMTEWKQIIMSSQKMLSNEELRALCIENDWFTCGTSEQYEKLFYANKMGCSIGELATIVWLCSDNVARRDILFEIEKKIYQNY